MNARAAIVARCAVCGERRRFTPVLECLHQCESCRFVTWLSGTMPASEQLYAAGYFSGGEYPDYLGAEDELRRSMRRHLEQMARVRPHGGALFEIGCAYGFFLDEARRMYARVAGADVSPEPIAWAARHLGLDVRPGDVRAMRFDEPFDVICCWDTIEHVPEPDTLVAAAARMLKPGGVFFATTGDIESANARRRGARWRQIHPPTHVNYFSPRTLGTMLGRFGFRVVSSGTASYYHTANSVLSTLALRGGAAGRLSAAAVAVLPGALLRRLGGWMDLGDTMFLAARLDTPQVMP